jgi:cytidylate kinase
LQVAPDAAEIDTTELAVDQVVDRIVGLARERGLVES